MNLINVGTNADDGTGDTLRDAFIKINNLYSQMSSSITIPSAQIIGGDGSSFTSISVGSGLVLSSGILSSTSSVSVPTSQLLGGTSPSTFTSISVGSGLQLVSNVLSATGGGGGDCSIDINAQTGTTYTVVAADMCKLVTFSNVLDIAVTLPDATTTGFESGWHAYFKNLGPSFVAITLDTSTADGAYIIDLAANQEVHIISDGTNYDLIRGVTGGINSTDSAIVAGAYNIIYGTASDVGNGIFVGSNNIINANGNGNFNVIIGGGTNTINCNDANTNHHGIFAGTNNTISTGEWTGSVLLGGDTNTAIGHDGGIVGGNANTVRHSAVIAGGANNSATGGPSFIGGSENSVLTGRNSTAIGGLFAFDNDNDGVMIQGGGSLDGTTGGQAQVKRSVFRVTTLDTTPARLSWDATGTTVAAIPDNTTMALNLTLVGRQGTTDHVTLSCIGAMIARDAGAGTTTLIGSPSFSITASTTGASGTVAVLTADTFFGAADITVTPPTNAEWHWVLLYEAVECG